MAKKDLVQIIRDNPGCVATVDNDSWKLSRVDPNTCPDFGNDYEAEEAWFEANTLARDEDVAPLGDGGYGSGNCYGGDLLQALAVIVGIKVESV